MHIIMDYAIHNSIFRCRFIFLFNSCWFDFLPCYSNAHVNHGYPKTPMSFIGLDGWCWTWYVWCIHYKMIIFVVFHRPIVQLNVTVYCKWKRHILCMNIKFMIFIVIHSVIHIIKIDVIKPNIIKIKLKRNNNNNKWNVKIKNWSLLFQNLDLIPYLSFCISIIMGWMIQKNKIKNL